MARQYKMREFAYVLSLLGTAASAAAFAATEPPAGWQTVYEQSGYTRTGHYDEAVGYCKRLAAASHGKAKVITWGVSPQGRALVALIMSSDGSFTPDKAAASLKPLVIINNGIHSGEIEGKDADLILARDILITGKQSRLLEHANVIVIPIFGVDAHERFGPYNRINQNGPEEMGWRANANNLNLNRDFMKADAGEMRGMLHLLHTWKPDFFFDNHTTDGADWQYSLQYDAPTAQTLAEPCVAWTRGMLAEVLAKVEADGYLSSPYFDGVDYNSLGRGLSISDFGPRYSTGYLAAINRPSMLVETHMLKPYKHRVDTTYSINVRTIEYINQTAADLKAANRAADARDAATKPGDTLVLECRTLPEGRPFVFKGLKYQPYRSDISGGMTPNWTRDPVNTPTTLRDQYAPALTIAAPAAYAIPPQWTEIIDRLKLHGLKLETLKAPLTADFETYRLDGVKFPQEPFESRFQPQFKAVPIKEKRTLPAGSVIVRTNQVGARLILQLLEPAAPDSFVHWGLMNAIFEQKEYFENYAMEPVARKLLADNPELKAAFDEKLKDPAFAASPRARLNFIYERSPWYDPALNKYPIVRMSTDQAGNK